MEKSINIMEELERFRRPINVIPESKYESNNLIEELKRLNLPINKSINKSINIWDLLDDFRPINIVDLLDDFKKLNQNKNKSISII